MITNLTNFVEHFIDLAGMMLRFVIKFEFGLYYFVGFIELYWLNYFE